MNCKQEYKRAMPDLGMLESDCRPFTMSGKPIGFRVPRSSVPGRVNPNCAHPKFCSAIVSGGIQGSLSSP